MKAQETISILLLYVLTSFCINKGITIVKGCWTGVFDCKRKIRVQASTCSTVLCTERFHSMITEVKCNKPKPKPKNPIENPKIICYFCPFHYHKSKQSSLPPIWVTTIPYSLSNKIWQESWIPTWWVPVIIYNYF